MRTRTRCENVIMGQRTVLISGAGIASSTAAFWLARAGWEVTVVEKAGAARSSGNPVDVRGDAAAIAHAMGVWPALEDAATGTTRLRLVDAHGSTRATVNTRTSPADHDEVEVARSHLADALLSAAREHAEVVTGDSITRLTQGSAGVDVDFEGMPSRRYDLVFGADGLHSAVRRLAFGPESDFSRPFHMFVGTMRTSSDVAQRGEVVMFNQPGISLSVHAGGGSPLAAFIFRAKEPYDHRDPAAGTRLIESSYARAGWIVPDILNEWRAADDVYFDSVTRIVMPQWTRGRVSLLGDAASCISLLGEGSSNAIVAAKTLADQLTAQPGDHETALAAYEHTHRKRLTRYLRGAGLGARFLVPATGPGLALRNTGLRISSRLKLS